MSFAHLHVHTEFSLLDGSNKIKEYVSRVKELGMNSAAITDHGVMYGVIDFYREAKKQGINPILGCEVYVAPNSRFDREITGGDDRYYHLVLLAENEEGYANLTKIVSKGFVEGYYYKPRVDKELLRKYHKGIIALSACLAGEVARFLTKGLYEEAKKTALEYQEIFGEGNFSWSCRIMEYQSRDLSINSYSKCLKRQELSWLLRMIFIIHMQKMRSHMIFYFVFRLERSFQMRIVCGMTAGSIM